MIARIHQKLGTAGFVISIVALVAALCGGAYAAGGGLTGKQKKEVKKIAKQFAGKPGAAGAPGAAGSAGAKGDTGAPGANGTNGADGTSVTTASFSGSKNGCSAGGVEVKSASPTVSVCNGKNGTTGFTETLPTGATEKGLWSFGASEETLIVASTSYVIPYSDEEAPTAVYVPFGEEEAHEAECPGTLAEPDAAEGYLCIYEEAGVYQGTTPTIESTPVGWRLVLSSADPELRFGEGSWAVTAE